MLAVRKRLMTAAEYVRLPDDGQHKELVRGRVEVMNMPTPRHGWHCFRAAQLLDAYARARKAGRVITNDSGVITERDPDTVRGADVAFYSYKRVAKGKLPKGYFPAPAEVVFEIRAATDRMSKLLKRIAEFLAAGVGVVGLIDPDSETITIFAGEAPPRLLGKTETLELGKLLPGFRVPVSKFFEEE
jgi:Uma2 family endonuclease